LQAHLGEGPQVRELVAQRGRALGCQTIRLAPVLGRQRLDQAVVFQAVKRGRRALGGAASRTAEGARGAVRLWR